MAERIGDSISLARRYAATGCFNQAFEVYLRVIQQNPQVNITYGDEFHHVLVKLNEILSASYKVQEIFSNFHQALHIYPDNPHLLNEIGKYLFHFGYYLEAWSHFQRALQHDAGLVNAEKNLNSVKNLFIERWHYRMLNDKKRNDAYRAAILKVVTSEDSVLDIGSGTGLLSFYASEKKPFSICGVESSEEMVKVSQQLIKDHNKSNIAFLKRMSYDLKDLDIGGKRSLLVTELFDAGLFGEHILKILAHAHENLILDGAKVIPSKAEFFIIGAKCDHIYLKYQLGAKAKKLLNIPNANVHINTRGESYDCEDVGLHKDLEYMTESQSLIQINFNDKKDVIMNLNRTEPLKIALKTVKNGEINVLIGWFNLYLTDDIMITTNPQSESQATAWQQAIFVDHVPITVEENQTVNLEFTLSDNKLSLVPNPNSNFVRISVEALRFLNDAQYTDMISKCMGVASTHLEQLTDRVMVADLCPFPVFGLLMLKRGAHTLTCCAKTDDDKRFLETVMEANRIQMYRLTILEGVEWAVDVFQNVKYHAVFVNILDLSGDIDIRMKDILQHLKDYKLVSGGLILPENIRIVVQLANSKWLDINNRVYDENTQYYGIASYLNKCQVSQNFDMDLSCLEYKPMSEPIILGSYTPYIQPDVVDIQIVKDGVVNSILCWYSLEYMENLGDIITRERNSFINSLAFLAYPHVTMNQGETCNIMKCMDPDGSFKLIIDVEQNNN